MQKLALLCIVLCCFSLYGETNKAPLRLEQARIAQYFNVEKRQRIAKRENTFVCAENGLNVRDQNNQIIGKLANAAQVEILGYTDEVFEVYDQGQVLTGRKAIINYYLETTNSSRHVEAYIFEGYLCSAKVVKIYDSELCQYYLLTDDYNAPTKCLKELLKLELVADNTVPKTVLKRETEFTNPEAYKKEAGVLELPTANGTLRIEDINDENAEDSQQIYQYLGDLEVLNSYVVSGQYWESGDVSLYDKTTGEEVALFEVAPQISPDQKHIISLNFEPYEGGGIVQWGTIENGKLSAMHNLNFLNWTIADQPDWVWLSNHSFLINVVHINAYWQKNGAYNENYQRLKITIL